MQKIILSQAFKIIIRDITIRLFYEFVESN